MPSFQKPFRPVTSEWKVLDCDHIAVSLATGTSIPKSSSLSWGVEGEWLIVLGKGSLSPVTIRN